MKNFGEATRRGSGLFAFQHARRSTRKIYHDVAKVSPPRDDQKLDAGRRREQQFATAVQAFINDEAQRWAEGVKLLARRSTDPQSSTGETNTSDNQAGLLAHFAISGPTPGQTPWTLGGVAGVVRRRARRSGSACRLAVTRYWPRPWAFEPPTRQAAGLPLQSSRMMLMGLGLRFHLWRHRVPGGVVNRFGVSSTACVPRR